MDTENISRVGRFIVRGAYGQLRYTEPEETAIFRQKRAALCFWWIERYREWGDDTESMVTWQRLHAAESLRARQLMGIE